MAIRHFTPYINRASENISQALYAINNMKFQYLTEQARLKAAKEERHDQMWMTAASQASQQKWEAGEAEKERIEAEKDRVYARDYLPILQKMAEANPDMSMFAEGVQAAVDSRPDLPWTHDLLGMIEDQYRTYSEADDIEKERAIQGIRNMYTLQEIEARKAAAVEETLAKADINANPEKYGITRGPYDPDIMKDEADIRDISTKAIEMEYNLLLDRAESAWKRYQIAEKEGSRKEKKATLEEWQKIQRQIETFEPGAQMRSVPQRARNKRLELEKLGLNPDIEAPDVTNKVTEGIDTRFQPSSANPMFQDNPQLGIDWENDVWESDTGVTPPDIDGISYY